MSDSNDPFGVFSASPSLPGLDPASYVARFDAPERGPASDADPRAAFLWRTARPEPDLSGSCDGRFIAEYRERGVGIAGAGLMGASIAALFLDAGARVAVYDPVPAALDSARVRIRAALEQIGTRPSGADPDEVERLFDSKVETLLQTTDSLETLADRSAVVEAIPEKIRMKAKFYGQLGQAARKELLLLTNTSSLRVADLAASLPTDSRAPICQARFAAFHFFHPIARRRLVEIAGSETTAAPTVAKLQWLARDLRMASLVAGDGPGLVVNRLLQAYLNESLKLLDEGLDPARLEAICRRVGFEGAPLRVMDEIGLDVSLHAGYSFLKAFPESAYPSTLLAGLVREGRLGRKSKHGFYRYETAESWAPDAVLDCDGAALERWREVPVEPEFARRAANLTDADVGLRILDAILREARLLLDGKIAPSGREIDAGLVLGLGFPASKGGILYWALATGRLSLN